MGTRTVGREVSLEYVSLDVVRGILSELDDVDDRLGKLDDLLVAHLQAKGFNRRELSSAARNAWSELEEIDSRVFALRDAIREQLEDEGHEVWPKGVELVTGRVIGDDASGEQEEA